MYHIGLSREEIDHIQHVIAKLDAEPQGESADRRVHPRIDFSHPMWLNLPTEPGSPWVHIFSRNLSTGGLSFLTRKIFYIGQHLVISHELKENTPLLVLAKVCFSRTVEAGIQEVGLIFSAIEYDPQCQRHVPARWISMVLQSDWLAQKKHAAPGCPLLNIDRKSPGLPSDKLRKRPFFPAQPQPCRKRADTKIKNVIFLTHRDGDA